MSYRQDTKFGGCPGTCGLWDPRVGNVTQGQSPSPSPPLCSGQQMALQDEIWGSRMDKKS